MKLIAGATGREIKVPFARRWWLPLSKRGTVTVADLPGLHELTPALAKRLSDYELHLFPLVRSNDDVARSVAAGELRRREGGTARLALAVSVVAVAISFAALFFHG